MSRMLCAKCGSWLNCKENGVLFADEENGNYAKADLYECVVCDTEILAGFGAWLLPDSGQRSLEYYREHGYTIVYAGEQ